MDLFNDQAMALRNVIAAQQEVIGAWEAVFSSVEGTILNLVKANIDLKVKLMRETDPDIVVPENIYQEMDLLKEQYHRGEISVLVYFEGLDALLTAIAK
jgi:hypothetical protein